jgi:hypothetical protein
MFHLWSIPMSPHAGDSKRKEVGVDEGVEEGVEEGVDFASGEDFTKPEKHSFEDFVCFSTLTMYPPRAFGTSDRLLPGPEP